MYGLMLYWATFLRLRRHKRQSPSETVPRVHFTPAIVATVVIRNVPTPRPTPLYSVRGVLLRISRSLISMAAEM